MEVIYAIQQLYFKIIRLIFKAALITSQEIISSLLRNTRRTTNEETAGQIYPRDAYYSSFDTHNTQTRK